MKKLLLAFSLSFISFAAQAQETVKIAGGKFEIKDANLSYNGKMIPIDSDIISVDFVGKYNLLNKDVLLFSESSGGNACPAHYFFVTVEQKQAKRTESFGTCSDLAKVSPQMTRIVVTMPTLEGKKTAYIYKDAQVTQSNKN